MDTPEELEKYYGEPFTPEKWAFNIKRKNTVLMEVDGWFLYDHKSSYELYNGDDSYLCVAHTPCMWITSATSFRNFGPERCGTCGGAIPLTIEKTILLMQ